MKCSTCKFYVKSKAYGNGCAYRGNKPCDIERKRKSSKKYREKRKWKLQNKTYVKQSQH